VKACRIASENGASFQIIQLRALRDALFGFHGSSLTGGAPIAFSPLLLAFGGREAGVEIAGERQVIAHQLGVLLAVRCSHS
jgi:hypothetical protein